MDEEGNLGYYLYNEATGEEKLFSKGGKEKMGLEDQDTLDIYENRKRRAVNRNKLLPIVSGTGGAMIGGLLGSASKKHSGKLALAGAAVGAAVGAIAGNKAKKRGVKKIEDEHRELVSKYRNANGEERAYLRRKLEKEMDRENRMNAAVVGGYLAGRNNR